MSWLSRWFGGRAHAHEDVESEDPSAAGDSVEAVASLLQKVARAQARQSLQVESIESKLEAGFADLRASLMAATSASGAGLRFDECFDAMDALDEAVRLAPSPEYARGLNVVLERLTSFLTRSGYQRSAAIGQPVDARRFRVVGTEVKDAQPPGIVVGVARAAVLRQGEVVREGEVIVSTRSA
jgi:molecular chaperone GrpE (heat shock protein)